VPPAPPARRSKARRSMSAHAITASAAGICLAGSPAFPESSWYTRTYAPCRARALRRAAATCRRAKSRSPAGFFTPG
jgi:hypothetical protein